MNFLEFDFLQSLINFNFKIIPKNNFNIRINVFKFR